MSSASEPRFVDEITIRRVLGDATAKLINTIAWYAQKNELSLFLVGGVIRDIILNRPNYDLDFVIESDAIGFADQLSARFGGTVLAHKPFGTAIWTLDASAAEKLSLPANELPQHIDFARARSEAYAQPAALPTVSPADINADLWRRDFTLNTLAIKLSPAQGSGRLLDECGGYSDLQDRLIRVLHERSFIDDPTRILRAIRLGSRLQFAIEAETETLMQEALPLLGRITGQRLVNEIDLILREPMAGAILLQLQELGALTSIQPAFRIISDLPRRLASCHETTAPWPSADSEPQAVLWCLLLSAVNDKEASSICQRLDLPQNLSRSITACARLIAQAAQLDDPVSPPSEAVRLLERLPDTALYAAWLLLDDSPTSQKKLADYMNVWRHQRARISGADLINMGIPTGPRYKLILDALRFAWIDGKVNSRDEEQSLLRELLLEES